MSTAFTTAVIGWRFTEFAGLAASRSWARCERAHYTGCCGGVRCRTAELSLALRSSAGSQLHWVSHWYDAPRGRSAAPGGIPPCAPLRGWIFARLCPAGGQRHGTGAGAQLLPDLGSADWRGRGSPFWCDLARRSLG